MTVAEKAKAKVGAKKESPTSQQSLVGYKLNDVEKWLSPFSLHITQCLPKHITKDRMIQLITTVIARSPEIKSCTGESVIGAIFNAAILGLDITPQFGQAYFVPYNNNKTGKKELQFMLGYKGWIQLFRRSNEVSTIYAEVVREGDDFTVEFGLDQKLQHIPNLQNRGKLIAVYAVVKYKDGGYNFVVLTEQDVLARKKRSKAVQYGKQTPWDTDTEQMWRKSALRALIPYVPASAEMLKGAITDGSVITTDMMRSDTKDVDLDMVKQEEEPEEAQVVSEMTKDEPAEATEMKKENDERVEFLTAVAKPAAIIKNLKGAQFLSDELGMLGYEELIEVEPKHFATVLQSLNQTADDLMKSSKPSAGKQEKIPL